MADRRGWFIIAFGLLFFVCTWGLNVYRAAYGGASQDSLQADEELIARRGRETVTAIYQFRRERGLWPCTMDELVPDYLKAEEARIWQLTWSPGGSWNVTCYNNLPNSAVQYVCRPGEKEQWVVTNGEFDDDLNLDQPKPAPRETDDAQLRVVRIDEIRRRVHQNPQKAVHYQGLISLLIRNGQLSEARAVCESYVQRWPGHWWPNAMLADIDARQGKFAEGEARLREWAEQYGEFGRRYLLADYLYYKADQPAKAHAALSKAARYRISGLGDGPSAEQFTGYDGSAVAGYGLMLACSEGWHDAALAVCDRWDEHEGADVSYLAARSACLLANGDFGPALAQLDRLRQTLARRCDPVIDDELHLPELRAAITAKNRAYHYPTSSLLQRHRIRLLIDYE